MRCPHCNKNIVDRFHEIAETNAESYGSDWFIFECPKCKKRYSIYIERVVKISKGKPEMVSDDKPLSYTAPYTTHLTKK